jgi:hypothetical protein
MMFLILNSPFVLQLPIQLMIRLLAIETILMLESQSAFIVMEMELRFLQLRWRP